MTKATLAKIFFRSLFIHATLNFRRMQNLGFVMSIIPLVRQWQKQQKDIEKILLRHMQMFNTHPYFSAPIIGSIVRLETDYADSGVLTDTVAVKQSLMGPYAAIGDIFFLGSTEAFRRCFRGFFGLCWITNSPVGFLTNLYTSAYMGKMQGIS
jgi:mannose/fructose/N-acetylgalactosamine-specific phosphotransferase system component IID